MIPLSYDEISRRAYELWEQEGRSHGSHQQHWLEAERQLSGATQEGGNPAYPSLEARERIVADNASKVEPVKKLPADALKRRR